ncbi:MAG: hypothetical protein AAGF07_02810 [Patescibacteria group bacterium]
MTLTNSESSFRNKLGVFSLFTGATIFTFVFTNFAVNTLGLFFKIPVDLAQFYISLLLTVGLHFYVFYKFIPQKALSVVLGILSLVLISAVAFGSLLVSDRIYDTSFDGQSYQMEAIIQLNEGYIPPHERPSGVPNVNQIWVNAYPKSAWINSTTVFKLTGNIESGKLFNLLLQFASLMLVFGALLSINKLNIFWGGLVSILAVANPVSLYQYYNYYLDGQTYSLILGMLALTLYIFNKLSDTSLKQKAILFVLFTFAGIYLFNIKLASFVFGVIMLLSICLFTAFYKTKLLLPFLGSLMTIFLLGFLIFGYNPYITNNRYNKSPLFPIFGEPSYNFDKDNVPGNYLGKNNVEMLIRAGFVKTAPMGRRNEAELKVPFTTDDKELKNLTVSNVKKGGFGIYWSGVLVVTLASLVLLVSYYLIKNRKLKDEDASNFLKIKPEAFTFLIYCYAICTILASAVIVSASVYARYVPQLWLVPTLVVLYFLTLKNHITKILAVIITGIMLYNAYMFFEVGTRTAVEASDNVEATLEEFSEKYTEQDPLVIHFRNATSTRQRLRQFNIPYEENKNLECSKKINAIPNNDSVICEE